MDEFENKLKTMNQSQLREYLSAGQLINFVINLLGILLVLWIMAVPSLPVIMVAAPVIMLAAQVSAEFAVVIQRIQQLLDQHKDK